MEQNWIEFLSTPDINDSFKDIIKIFFIPDNILVKEFIANYTVLEGGESVFSAKNDATNTFKGLNTAFSNTDILQDLVQPPYSAKDYATNRYMGLHTVFPPLYPLWYIAAYPDVVNWAKNNYNRSKVLNTITDEKLIDIEDDTQLKNDFLRQLIDEYLLNVSDVLECTEPFKRKYVERLLEYPKKEYDNLGRMIKETFLLYGYETTHYFQYNNMNQVVRIDEFGENVYEKWELKPREIFEYDNNGLIKKYSKYYTYDSEIESKIFFSKYDSNNNLILSRGPYKTPMYSYYVYDLCLKLNYVGENVEILFDHEFYDNDYKNIEKKISQLEQQIENEYSKEEKHKLRTEIINLRENLIANSKQKSRNIGFDRFYKKESDTRYTLITTIPTGKLISVLNSYTGIEQLKGNDFINNKKKAEK